MHTGDRSGAEDDTRIRGNAGRPERIGVGGGDDAVVRIQLAARWAEQYAPEQGDSLRAALKRFRHAFDYLDAVTHGLEPSEEPVEEPRPSPIAG
jgi:hypothetical protein